MTQVQFDEFGNVSILDTKKEFNIYQSSLKKKEKPPSLVGSTNRALAKIVYNWYLNNVEHQALSASTKKYGRYTIDLGKLGHFRYLTGGQYLIKSRITKQNQPA